MDKTTEFGKFREVGAYMEKTPLKMYEWKFFKAKFP
jgi:hypothetical protein